MKKKLHNGKRPPKGRLEERKPVENNISNVSPAHSSDIADTNQEQVDETMIKHLQVTLRMLEGRKVSRFEVLQLIKEMRQHSIDIEKELGYLGSEPKNKSG